MVPSKKPMKHPEAKIQKEIITMLERRGWFVRVMHSSASLDGIPDLYAVHPSCGPRWVEVKLPFLKGSRFTKAQKREFPKFLAAKAGIWILTAANKENYDRLFKASNCGEVLRAKAMGCIPNV